MVFGRRRNDRPNRCILATSLASASGVARILAVSFGLIVFLTANIARAEPVDLVDPFMGTREDRGQLSPASAAPFGMIQIGPDTTAANHIGYDRNAGMLRGFSHTRAEGVGCDGGGGDLLVRVAYTGEPELLPMDKTSERAGPGWYTVRYGTVPVSSTLVAGEKTAIAQFTASVRGMIELSLDPRHSYARHVSARWISTTPADLKVDLANGTVCDKGVYRLSYAGAVLLNGTTPNSEVKINPDGVLRMTIPVERGDTIEWRVAVSTVDAASARITLVRMLGHLTLNELRNDTRAAWNAYMGNLQVYGPESRRSLFYTALYRALQMPARIDDTDGRYRDTSAKIRAVPRRRHRYAGWSLWDNYRTQIPLLAFAAPDVARDVGASLTELYEGEKDQWAGQHEPFLSVRTEHAGIALLDLYRKRLIGKEAMRALPGMVAEVNRLPDDTPDEKIELAYDKWAISQLAGEAGASKLSAKFASAALDYRKMWLEVFGAPGPDGDVVKARGLYQGTIWQYRWAPVFDLDWLRTTALGLERFRTQLDEFFDHRLYNMTNEPDIHAPFLFTLTDEPHRADEIVSDLLDHPYEHWYENKRKYDKPFVQPSFSLDPGFAEGMDDDGGAMSAWFVWASLGLYPLVPGQPRYVVTLPAFENAAILVGGGRSFNIRKEGPDGARVIRSIMLNGQLLQSREITHDQIMRGGSLVIKTEISHEKQRDS